MKNRWFKLITAVVVLLFSGLIYAWSILKAPFAEKLGFTASQLSLNFTVLMCCFCLGGLVSGLISKKVSSKLRMLIAAVMVCVGMLLQGLWLTSETLYLMYIGYGVLFGGGVGVVYNTVIAAVNSHFADKKGLASGAMMMGFGFSTLIFGTIAKNMFDSSLGWRTTYILLGAVIAVVILIGGFIITPNTVAVNQSKTNDTDVSSVQMLKKASFWMLFVFFVMFAAVGNTAIQDAKGLFARVGADADLAATLVGLLSVFNGLGRIVSGALFDAIGLRKMQFVTSEVAILATFVTLLGILTDITVLGAIGLCLCGFCYGFSPTVSAAFAAKFYGQAHFSLNFALLNLVLIPASFVPTVLSGCSDTITFAVLLAMSVAGLILNIFIKKA